MADSKEKLFSDFSPVSKKEWNDKIQVDLKGADYEKRLVWRTNEGFKVQPFYQKEDIADLETTKSLPGEFPFIRGIHKNDNTWFIRQEIEVETAETANEKALDILMKGIDSLNFMIKESDLSAAFIATLLKDIQPECVELNFRTSLKATLNMATLVLDYFKAQNYDLTKIAGSFHFDPMAEIIVSGNEVDDFAATAKALVELTAALPKFRCINVDAVALNNAGAYITQELGFALSWGTEYLNLLTDAGVNLEAAAKAIKFNFGISANYFMEMAKFRAARMLWANIVKQYDESASDEACKMIVHAETSTFNMTLFDAHVNLLRTQTEAMSAALGGVQSITVLPFDKTYQKADAFSERIARNQQLLLKEECHFNKVVDPAGGSYYIETLTDSLLEEAWKIFLAEEEKGGFLINAKAGKVQEIINESGKARLVNISRRKEVLLGTNQFPNFTETSDNKKPVTETAPNKDKKYETLTLRRAASEFEELRLATEKSGKQPVAFMLTIGNLAMRQARAQFSCNFLACAGYKVIDNLGFPTVEEGVEAAMKANADIIVLCSSDTEYTEYAVSAFKAVDGRAMFIVAGAPACMDELKEAGIEDFIHVRVNVLDTLRNINKKLGIK
jgi:methylmalonyl-CoA mutase